jgi:hypothetical protein
MRPSLLATRRGHHFSLTSSENWSQRTFIFGYCLPLPLGKAKNIPGILLAPINIQKQNTIDEHGRIVEKDRLTHNQSFKWSSGTSVNNQAWANKLLPCMFGACIMQIVNWVVTA